MTRKKLEDLNLIDNFLFDEVMNTEHENIAVCRILLSTILQREFKNIRIIPQRNIPGQLPETHGIRMDAYIEADEISNINLTESENAEIEIKNSIYDIEPNTYKTNSEAKRTRYYHSLIDSKILKSGIDYEKLKNVVIIMLLPYDPFGKNRLMYTFQTTCIEEPSIPYDDGVTTIFLYTKGTEGSPSQKLKDMLKYIENTTIENATNEDLKNVHKLVKQIKNNEEVGVRYMKSWEYEELARREGVVAGMKEGKLEVAKNLLDILDPTTIASKTGLSESEVLALANEQ